MFSTLIEKILLQILGQYIDGIKNSMDVALLKGKIKIQNVSLKKDFFNNLSLPLRLAFSLIESINIHIPWSNLKQKPTTVEVDGIYALFYVNYQMEEYKFDAEKRLNEMIDKATELIKMKFEEKQRDSGSIVEKYILGIIDNLKVTVKNVHVRLQSMERKWDFSMGLLVDNVEIYTINQKGERHFFVRSKRHGRHGHIHIHHRKEKHETDDELLKKVAVENVRIYFTEYETNFMTVIQGGQLKLKQMKTMLDRDRQMLLGQERAKNEPNIILRLRLQAILRAKLNDTTNKYDINIHATFCPLTVNLTDRMTAEIFYFLQFAFQWQMRKYKRPNKDVPTSPQMVNFYKLMLYNILSDTPIHKSDYKNLIRLISEWEYDFLNDMTIEFVQQQKVKKQLSKKKNRKISGDVVMLEQFKKQIQQQVLTQEDKKEIFDIIGRVGANIFIPIVEIVLMKSKDQYDIFAQKQSQILKIGCQGISLNFNTLWSKDQSLTLQIKDLIFFSQTQVVEKKISTEPLKETLSQQQFLSIIFTKSIQQQVESFSINLSKRLIRINQRLVSKLISWSGSIKLRPGTVNYLKQICIHYTTEIVKILLEKLFRQFRVINLNIGLPIVEIVMDDFAYGMQEKEMIKQNVMRLDLGRFEGKLVQQGMYRFQFTEDANLTVNKKSVVNLSTGTSIEIFDKVKILQPQVVYQIKDRQRICLKIDQLKIQNIDSMIDFICVIIGSRILQQFLRIKIVEDQSTLLQGTFYLNNNPRRQKIILKSDKLCFMPSKYTISLKQCKVYQMKASLRNYLVFNSFIKNKTDVVEVENQLAMETIFYKLRQQIHQVATTSEWDMFYKADYPVTIQKLQMLKSHHGENLPFFNFDVFINQISLPLGRYLQKQQEAQNKDQFQQNLIGRNALQVLQFIESDNQSIYHKPSSILYISQIYLKISCYQLTKDFFSDIKQIQLIIEDEPMFNNFSFSSSLIKTEFFLLNLIINSFQLSIQKKQKLKSLLEIGFYFETQVEKLINAAKQCDLWDRIEKITKQNEKFSMLSLSSSNSFMDQQVSRISAYQPKGIFRIQQSMLLTLRMTIKMKQSKLNILNYITQFKNLQNEIDIYRTQQFPLIKIKIDNVIIMSLIELKNVQFRIQKDYQVQSKINCVLNVDKICSYPNIQLLIMDMTQGEISGLICQIIQHLGRRRQYRKNQTLQKPTKIKQPHVQFQQFISPIKQRKQQFMQSKKDFNRSMKSLNDQLLMNEKEVYLIDIESIIKGIDLQIILTQSQPSFNITVSQIKLKQNNLLIQNIKAIQNQQQLFGCKSIVIQLPQNRQYNIEQKLYQQQNISIEQLTRFQSPMKSYQKQVLIQKQQPLQQHQQQFQQNTLQQNIKTTHVQLNTLTININLNLISSIILFIQQSMNKMRRSVQYNQLRQKITTILLKTVKKRQQIQKVIKLSQEKFIDIKQNIKQSIQSPIEIKWLVNFKEIIKNITILTTQPIKLLLVSNDNLQILSSQINLHVDYPQFLSSFLTMQISHFNKMIQVYEPVLERMQIKIMKLKQQIQVNMIDGLRLILSEQLLVDMLKQAEIFSSRLKHRSSSTTTTTTGQITTTTKSPPITTTTTDIIHNLQQKKLLLYKKYSPISSTKIQQTIINDQQTKQHTILQQQLSMQLNKMINTINNKNTLQDLYKYQSRYSKMQIRNYTGCNILCQLVQQSYPLQRMNVISDYYKHQQYLQSSLKTVEQQLTKQQYFLIPFNLTASKFTTSAQFIQRQRPIRLQIQFINQNIIQSSEKINIQILFSQICRLGVKTQTIELFYNKSNVIKTTQLNKLQQQDKKLSNSTMIQLMIRFQYMTQMIIVQIRPIVEIVNYTVMDVRIQREIIGIEKQTKNLMTLVQKNSSKYLPLFYQNDNSVLNINLPDYQKSTVIQQQFNLSNFQQKQQQHQQKSYTLPLQSQQNLQQNYPKDNVLILKQSFIHYFDIQLGKQQCYIPLLFVKIKKYEKFIDKKTKQNVLKQTKCKIVILPLIKLENHLDKEIWVNGECYCGDRVVKRHVDIKDNQPQSSLGGMNAKKKQRQQKAVYFFLKSQVDKSITHMMLSFTQKGYNYHIPLPQNLYIPKPLTFPTQGQSLAPIAFNLLTTKNQYGQVVLHFYPLIQVIMQLPFAEMQVRMVSKLNQREKICQGLVTSIVDDLSKVNLDKQKIDNKKLLCYLLPQQHKLIKLQMAISNSIGQTSLSNNNTQQQILNNYLSSTLPDKKHLTFINLYGDQFLSSITRKQEQNGSSSQSINSSQSSSSQQQSSSSQSISTNSVLSQQYDDNLFIQSIKQQQIYIPTITQQNDMLFCRCLIKRIQKRFILQQQLPSIYTISEIDQMRQQTKEQKIKYQKYTTFQIILLARQGEQYLDIRQLQNVQNRRQLIQEQLVGEIKQVTKLQQLQQKLTKKLASKSINILIKQINFSFIIQKLLSPSYNPLQQLYNYTNTTKSTSLLTHHNIRHQLMNVTFGEIECGMAFGFDQINNNVYQVQIQQRIGLIRVNSIDCQSGFGQAIVRLAENKCVSVLVGLRIGAVFQNQNKNDINIINNKQNIINSNINKVNTQQQQDNNDTPTLTPTIQLNKLLIKIITKQQPLTQRQSISQNSLDYDFNIKVTDKFLIETFNWLIKMYPIISAVISPDIHKSLLDIILESDSLNQFLEQFQGLMLVEEIKLKLAFLSISNKKGSSLNMKKNKKINKQVENQKAQQFLSQLLKQYDSNILSSQVDRAYRQSKTMQRILRYIKKIPFSVLQVENSHITIPQIAINGKLQKETLRKFQRQVIVNFTTGIIKGMKLLGSPSSLMDYLEKNKNKKKRQKLSGLLNRLAKGSIMSFTGILRSFSNGISQLTFDQKFKQERQDTMESSIVTEKESKPKQGLKSLFLGIKSGFSGLVQQPVQNYKQEGAQGFIKGSLKGVTGLITKPLTGILDLGTKALQNVRTQKKGSLNERLNLIDLQKATYCRPLFHQCSLIRRFNHAEYLSFIVLKSVFGGNMQLGLISSFELKQNPFNQDKKRIIEKQNIALKLLDPIRYLISICVDRTYFIQIGNENDYRLVYKQIDHEWIKMIGRDQTGICLVVQNKDFEDQDEKESEFRDLSKLNEVFLNPLYTDEKEEIFMIYKKLTKK